MHIECMVMHDVQNESLVFLYQLGTLSPLPSGEKEVSQTPHCTATGSACLVCLNTTAWPTSSHRSLSHPVAAHSDFVQSVVSGSSSFWCRSQS